MQEKEVSAADLSSILVWSHEEDLIPELQARPKQISKVRAGYHTLSNSDPLAVEHQTKPNHKKTKGLVRQKVIL